MIKVLFRNKSNILEGCCRRSEFPLEYRVFYPEDGTVVVPRVEGTKLFIFDEVGNALEFIDAFLSGVSLEIWEVEATNPVPVKWVGDPTMPTRYWKSVSLGLIEDRNTRWEICASPAPNGSYWCDSLKLIRRFDAGI